MRYAQILNGKVHWIFEDTLTLKQLGEQKFNLEQIQLIDITDTTGIVEGWSYENGVFMNSNVVNFEDLKATKLAQARTEFVRRRDAIRWIGDYGYDCAPEDISNFMAAYMPIMVAGTGTTLYVVWISETTKQQVELTVEQMTAVYNTVRASQFLAYQWYTGENGVKQQIEAAETEAELDAITW